MEILLEIENHEAEKPGISNNEKISLQELKRKLSAERMQRALAESHVLAKQYGLDRLSEDDVNDIIKEAREDYKKQNDKETSKFQNIL